MELPVGGRTVEDVQFAKTQSGKMLKSMADWLEKAIVLNWGA